MTLKGINGKTYSIPSEPFAKGGEGAVYRVTGRNDIVIKIYFDHLRTEEKKRKLIFMVNNPPVSTGVSDQFTWPVDVLFENGRFVGFVMPLVSGKVKLREKYAYGNRGNSTWDFYVSVAQNLAASIYAVHSGGHVLGDMNPDNILINPTTGMVSLCDCDSYHLRDGNTLYRCKVAKPEFVAPELQSVDLSGSRSETFTEYTDRFALAILIFQLLFNGAHPFSVISLKGSASAFQQIDNIAEGRCAYFPETLKNAALGIPPYSPDINCLPDVLVNLFRRAFVEGIRNPKKRPSAEEWYNGLDSISSGNLIQCSSDKSHVYYKYASKCPWCEVDRKMNKAQSTFEKSMGQNRTPFQRAFNGTGSNTATNTGTESSGKSYNAGGPVITKNTGTSGNSGTGFTPRSYRRRSKGQIFLDILSNIGEAILDVFKWIFEMLFNVIAFIVLIVIEYWTVALAFALLAFILVGCATGRIQEFVSNGIMKLTDRTVSEKTEEKEPEEPAYYEGNVSLLDVDFIYCDDSISFQDGEWQMLRESGHIKPPVVDGYIRGESYNIVWYDLDGDFDTFTGVWAVQFDTHDMPSDFEILGDGEVIYSSPEIVPYDAPVEFEVDVSDVDVMAIMFKHAYGDTVIGSPVLHTDGTYEPDDGFKGTLPIWLTSIPESRYDDQGDYYMYVKDRIANDGSRYSNCIFGRSAGTSVEYDLDGKYDRLTGIWAIYKDDDHVDYYNSFEVYADDILVYTSPSITGGDDPVYIDVNLDGCDKMTVYFTEGRGAGEFGNVMLYPVNDYWDFTWNWWE